MYKRNKTLESEVGRTQNQIPGTSKQIQILRNSKQIQMPGTSKQIQMPSASNKTQMLGAGAPKQQQIQVSAALNKKNCDYPVHQIQTFEQSKTRT